MTNRLLQPSFTAGEVSPSLHARVDTARYAVGLKRCRNMIVRPYGGVENRAGFQFLSPVFDETQDFRALPFVYSTETAYVIELGHLVARFYAAGALVQVQASDVVAWVSTTTFPLHGFTKVGSVVYRSLQAGNLNHAPASSPTWWVADPTLVLATPWTAAMIFSVRYTQSADVLYLVHPATAPRELRRLTPSFFEIRLHVYKEGPFRDLNANEATTVVSSAQTGTVTLTSNGNIFTANAIGSLFYLETKNLGQLKPWIVGERGITQGALRRSDGKTYKAVTVPSGGTWHEAGNRQPIHEVGRSWDGGGDTKTNGTDTWSVGIEWEYQDSGYGVVQITGVTSPTVATGTVTKRLPVQVVGTVTAPTATWPHTGDGTTRTFSLAGADLAGTYTVTIGGAAVQSDPNYQPERPIGGGGGGDGGGYYDNDVVP